jgi:DNA-binding SARP family transcriptional activator
VLTTEPLRVWICGAVVVERPGRRIEIPAGQTRTLFAYLAADRHRAASRSELVDVLWPDETPTGADGNLSALLSRLRKAVGEDLIAGRSELQLLLPFETWVDLEVATEALDRATGCLAADDAKAALPASHVAALITGRNFLPGASGPWVDSMRHRLDEMFLRAHECSAEASLRQGRSERDTAERSARILIERSPLRESGYRFLMECLAARGNHAEALRVFASCRDILRDELGVDPGPELQELHARLLRAAG